MGSFKPEGQVLAVWMRRQWPPAASNLFSYLPLTTFLLTPLYYSGYIGLLPQTGDEMVGECPLLRLLPLGMGPAATTTFVTERDHGATEVWRAM